MQFSNIKTCSFSKIKTCSFSNIETCSFSKVKTCSFSKIKTCSFAKINAHQKGPQVGIPPVRSERGATRHALRDHSDRFGTACCSFKAAGWCYLQMVGWGFGSPKETQ